METEHTGEGQKFENMIDMFPNDEKGISREMVDKISQFEQVLYNDPFFDYIENIPDAHKYKLYHLIARSSLDESMLDWPLDTDDHAYEHFINNLQHYIDEGLKAA